MQVHPESLEDLTKSILAAGVENVLFMVPMRPLRSALFGLFRFTSSEDPEVTVPARITEERYEIADNYKIQVEATWELFGRESFYISDLQSMIRDGRIQMFIKTSV